MLRPTNKAIEKFYYLYLRASVGFTAWLYGSGSASVNCKTYFIDALRQFYFVAELSELLRRIVFVDVGRTVGFHKAVVPAG